MNTILETAEQKAAEILSMLSEKNITDVKVEITPTRFNDNMHIDLFFQTKLDSSIITFLECNDIKTMFNSETNTTNAYFIVSHHVCDYSMGMYSKRYRNESRHFN